MNPYFIIFILILISILISFITFKIIKFFKKIEENDLKYYNFENNNLNNEFKILKIKNIFTKYELIFYNELKILLKNTNYNLLSKVRIADLIEFKDKVPYSNFIKIFNKINRKHIDFLISDENWNILILIELDWYSHNYKKTIESDNLKNSLFSTLQIPLLRFENWYEHDLEQIKKLLYI